MITETQLVQFPSLELDSGDTIAPVDVDPIEVGGEVYFRVRVGPFSAANEAEAALARVTGAGYQGAKIVAKN